ncbi:MAG: hypothetical protein O3A00_25750, partial [Planctomycetota bacterium]|nr:hypothetical protein [Planctomycetota bacterium]
ANAWQNGVVNPGGIPNNTGGLQPTGFNPNSNPAAGNQYYGAGNNPAANTGLPAQNNFGSNDNFGSNPGAPSTVPGSLQPNPNVWSGGQPNGNPQGRSDVHIQAGMNFANPLPVNSNPGNTSPFPSTPIMETGSGSMHGAQFQQTPQYQPPGQPFGSTPGGVDLTNRNLQAPGGFPLQGSNGQFSNNGYGGANTQNGMNSNMNGANSSFNTSAAQSALSGAANPMTQFDQQMQQFPSGQNTQLQNGSGNSNLGTFNNPATARY